MRNPERPLDVINYEDVSDDELFEVARLVIAMEIAKIHTIEWTTQLLYNEPLYKGMNSNWSGVLGPAKDNKLVRSVLAKVINKFRESSRSMSSECVLRIRRGTGYRRPGLARRRVGSQ